MMNSHWEWVEPFELTYDWEREDRDSGRVIDDEYELADIRSLPVDGEEQGCNVGG